ncbi:flagellar basal-body rod modification protein FlgD [Actimicrobium sp. GrIS 1.19]|uniref:flagellar hook assembly protein FlgD n=1 Tax=Actimicrobium sp. GrIS 1.19 TaxID=3071708 RepID=UPI002DFE16ED|nr:flagellar basal-body rod modification protein FlgD [Actimicrobium sp. GrIS 1.19]
MSSIAGVANTTPSADLLASVNGTKAAAAATGSVEETQDRFLKLLVTQMKNQDPLNPLDSAQVTSQLAQLSTVSGIDKVNTTLESLKTSFQSNESVQAAGLIGHGVLAPSKSISLSSGKAIFGIDLPSPADKVQVVVKDAAGNAVHTIDLGPEDTGTTALTWDGSKDDGTKAVDGTYTFEVTAKQGATAVVATALGFGEVGSVSTGTAGVKLNVTGLGPINFNDVRQIL